MFCSDSRGDPKQGDSRDHRDESGQDSTQESDIQRWLKDRYVQIDRQFKFRKPPPPTQDTDDS